MKEASIYSHKIEIKHVDLSQRASLPSMIDTLLTTAGLDAEALGFGMNKLNRESCSWVLHRIIADFTSLPKAGEILKIATWVSDSSRALSNRNFSITNDKDEIIGTALSQWCIINLESRTLVSLKDLGIINRGNPLPLDRKHKIDTSSVEHISDHIVRYSDIDVNRHVNTLRYIEMMLDQLPISMLEKRGSIKADISFMKESIYGETLKIYRHLDRQSSIFDIRKEDGTTSVKAQFDIL